MDVNVGPMDRMTRIILGTGLAFTALMLPNGWGIALVSLALIIIVEGATGRCLLYRLLGISTAHSGSASPARAAHPTRVERLDDAELTPDHLTATVHRLIQQGRVGRLSIRDGDWTVIDLPLTMTGSGALEAPLLEFLRSRAEVAGYYKLTVRH